MVSFVCFSVIGVVLVGVVVNYFGLCVVFVKLMILVSGVRFSFLSFFLFISIRVVALLLMVEVLVVVIVLFLVNIGCSVGIFLNFICLNFLFFVIVIGLFLCCGMCIVIILFVKMLELVDFVECL